VYVPPSKWETKFRTHKVRNERVKKESHFQLGAIIRPYFHFASHEDGWQGGVQLNVWTKPPVSHIYKVFASSVVRENVNTGSDRSRIEAFCTDVFATRKWGTCLQ
jgi:hypothetical protein